jgi:Glycosyltransferase family 9 (heptosyltransferase)
MTLDPLPRYRRAIAGLLAGSYAQGFADYDARWEAGHIPRPADTDAAIVGPEWRGGNLQGKRLLLHAEQGAGDSIQFLRYVPLVAALGPQIVLEMQPSLRGLAEYFRPQCTVGTGVPLGRYDLHCSLMSLPALFGTTIDTVPAPARFDLPTDLCERWRTQIPKSETRNAGLVWAGNPEHSRDAHRSIGLGRLLPLIGRKDVRFYSFQIGEQSPIIDLAPQLTSFLETAAALQRMDLVITVDTAVAHLAGSLGIEVWLLLPFAPCWRWMLDRQDTPWYPSMRLFRQTFAGDWDSVIQRVIESL